MWQCRFACRFAWSLYKLTASPVSWCVWYVVAYLNCVQTKAYTFLFQPKTNPAYPEVDFEYEEQKQPLDEWQELQAESEKQIGDHDNPDCFGWTVMNVCITKHITSAVKAVVAAAGVEILGEH